MKIAIDKGPLAGGHAVRGVGVYTRELIKALERKSKEVKELQIKAVDFSKEDLSKYNLVHYPSFHPFFLTLPFRKRTKTIVTIHDLIPLIYPKYYPSGIKGRFKFLVQKVLVKKVDGVIAVSETSKKDIVRFLGVPQEKIHVIYEAPRKIFKKLETGDWKLEIKKKYGLPNRFVLYVGDVNYNKNILGLAEACKIAKTPLVIVGKQAANEKIDLSHPENQPFAEFLGKYGKDPKVLRLGFIADEDLVAIYNSATIYCQPSFYEGFGLPVLEAMACGTPVVAAKTQALVEIANKAAFFADPEKLEDMAEKILELLENSELRAQLIRKGGKRAKEFTWDKNAKETAQLYYKVLAK